MSDHFSYDSTFISDYLGTIPQYNFGEKILLYWQQNCHAK